MKRKPVPTACAAFPVATLLQGSSLTRPLGSRAQVSNRNIEPWVLQDAMLREFQEEIARLKAELAASTAASSSSNQAAAGLPEQLVQRVVERQAHLTARLGIC